MPRPYEPVRPVVVEPDKHAEIERLRGELGTAADDAHYASVAGRLAALLGSAHEGRQQAPATDVAERAQRVLSTHLSPEASGSLAPAVLAIKALIDADADSATEWLEHAHERARLENDQWMTAVFLHLGCAAHLRRGEPAAAAADGLESIRFARASRAERATAWAAAGLARAQIALGDLDAAEGTLEDSEPPGAQLPDRLAWARSWSRAGLLMARGEVRWCLEVTLDAVDRFQPAGPEALGWRARVALCLTALSNESSHATALADDEVQIARAWGAPGVLGPALLVQGLVRGDADGEASIREAVTVLEGSLCKLELARAYVELGAALRHRGGRRESRATLCRGLDLARSCGARSLVEQAEQELIATGGSVREPAPTSNAVLTAAEQRICELAASGMSNRQIAAALCVGVRTVESELLGAQRKLGDWAGSPRLYRMAV